VSNYIPEQGDIVWLEFDPQAGHEQAGHRPAITLSRIEYNNKTRLAIFCPITSKVKGYPFEVLITGKKTKGAILSDQVKSLDWKARNVKFIERLDESAFDEVLSKLKVIIEMPRSRWS
jgi:mRNA interferase MazF